MSEKSNAESISLNKYIASTGICSRRKADLMIKDGLVTLNGVVAKSGNRVGEGDIVLLNGKPLNSKPSPIYILLNKPPGIVCTTDLEEPRNIIDFIGHDKRLFPIGRLDMASQGLILLTNDGDIVNKVLRSTNNHEKEYLVRVKKEIAPEFLQSMSKGVPILGTTTKPCIVKQVNEYAFRIILTQGLNRQIRRMCEYLDYEVGMIKRTRVMHMTLSGLRIGEWRDLTTEELLLLNERTENSVK